MHKFDKLEPKKPYLLTEYENGYSILDNDDNQFVVLMGAKKQKDAKGKGIHKVHGQEEWKLVSKSEEGEFLGEEPLEAETEEEAFKEAQSKLEPQGELTPVSPTALKYWE